MCTGSPDEQQLYHSISTVATLLLQIGEVGKQYKARPNSLLHNTSSTSADVQAVSNDPEAVGVVPLVEQTGTEQIVSKTLDLTIVDILGTNDLLFTQTAEECGGSNSNECDRHDVMQDNDNASAAAATLAPVTNDPLSDALSDDRRDTDSECEDIIRQLEEAHQPQQPVNLAENTIEEPDSPNKSMRDGKPDPDWSINFEQFLASMLTEPHLVAVFEKDTNIIGIVEKYRRRRLKPSNNDDSNGQLSSLPNKR